MADIPKLEKIEELTESLKRYISTNFELIKLEASERSSVVGSGMVSGLIVGLLGILFVFFLSLAAGFYLSTQLRDNYSGFLIVAGFYFLVGLIFLVGRKKLVEKPMRDKIIKSIFSKN